MNRRRSGFLDPFELDGNGSGSPAPGLDSEGGIPGLGGWPSQAPAREKSLAELLYPDMPQTEEEDLARKQAENRPLPEGTTLAQALYPDWNQEDWGLSQPGGLEGTPPFRERRPTGPVLEENPGPDPLPDLFQLARDLIAGQGMGHLPSQPVRPDPAWYWPLDPAGGTFGGDGGMKAGAGSADSRTGLSLMAENGGGQDQTARGASASDGAELPPAAPGSDVQSPDQGAAMEVNPEVNEVPVRTPGTTVIEQTETPSAALGQSPVSSEYKRIDLLSVGFQSKAIDQPVAPAVADGLKKAREESGGEHSYTISSTTGGDRSPNSDHSKGKAVDITQVSGKDVGGMNEADQKGVMDTFKKNPGVRTVIGSHEAYYRATPGGPFLPMKGDAWKTQHRTHIHVGFF